jgi:hypothetical protein
VVHIYPLLGNGPINTHPTSTEESVFRGIHVEELRESRNPKLVALGVQKSTRSIMEEENGNENGACRSDL